MPTIGCFSRSTTPMSPKIIVSTDMFGDKTNISSKSKNKEYVGSTTCRSPLVFLLLLVYERLPPQATVY